MHDAQATATPHPHLVIVTRDSESLRRLCLPLLCSSPDWLPWVPSIFSPNPQGVWTSRCHGNRPPPARRSNLWPPTFSIGASQSKSLQHNFFFLVSPFGQGEATGRPHSDNFLEPEGKGPFCEVLCNPALAATRVGGSQLGPGLGGLGGTAVGVLPRRSRVQGPRAPRLLPLQSPGDPGDLAFLHAGAPTRAGVRARDPRDSPLWPRALTRSAPAGGR